MEALSRAGDLTLCLSHDVFLKATGSCMCVCEWIHFRASKNMNLFWGLHGSAEFSVTALVPGKYRDYRKGQLKFIS